MNATLLHLMLFLVPSGFLARYLRQHEFGRFRKIFVFAFFEYLQKQPFDLQALAINKSLSGANDAYGRCAMACEGAMSNFTRTPPLLAFALHSREEGAWLNVGGWKEIPLPKKK